MTGINLLEAGLHLYRYAQKKTDDHRICAVINGIGTLHNLNAIVSAIFLNYKIFTSSKRPMGDLLAGTVSIYSFVQVNYFLLFGEPRGCIHISRLFSCCVLPLVLKVYDQPLSRPRTLIVTAYAVTSIIAAFTEIKFHKNFLQKHEKNPVIN